MASINLNRPRTPEQASRRRAPLDRRLDVQLFKALGDSTRARLLACLVKCGRACSVSEVAQCCSVDFSVVARHLALLSRAGVLTAEKKGRTMWYQVCGAELSARLRALADDIDKWRPNSAVPDTQPCCAAIPAARRPRVNLGRLAGRISVVLLTVGSALMADEAPNKAPNDVPARRPVAMFEPVAAYVAARQAEFDRIPAERRAKLEELVAIVRKQRADGKPARLTFICTHNSRRSQLAQVWATIAAAVYGIDAEAYSGGVEVTSFNPRAVDALVRAGLQIDKPTASVNPAYHLRFGPDAPAVLCFSKKFDDPANPRDGFVAIMVCGDADKSCPKVPGASSRIAIPYVDPKDSDGKPTERAIYDERSAQIAREMLYMMSLAAR